ncbi:MAG TPA: methyltransferase domain-containing protein [Actinomycetota bacterium]|nr:methyltransferase domain-containing protein [Actinomycetota bacterium]
MTTPVLEAAASAQRDALAERIFKATIESFELLHLYVGERLGLYRALADLGGANAAELAAAAGVAERYAREWLEQQAVAGVVEVTEDPDGEAARRYRLPTGHAEVLLDGDSESYMAPLTRGVASVARTIPAVLEAFRSGGGVPYEDYGPDLRASIALLNRPMFLNQLASRWLPALPALHARLQADPPAQVADVGCGAGWSSIAIALAYPKATVHGLDLDEASITEARRNAAEAGVADRVAFEVRDAADPSLAGRFDLVCAFETVHDMADPVAALRAMRALRADGGVALVGDEKVAEAFTAPGDELERFNYGWSALHCLPSGMVQQPSAGTGTVMRPATLRRYARQAGFAEVGVLPIEHDFWRFYRLAG